MVKILLIANAHIPAAGIVWKWYMAGASWMDTVRNMDMISSLSSGVTNVTKDVFRACYCCDQLWMVGE